MIARSALRGCAPLLLLTGIALALSGCGSDSWDNGVSAMGASVGGNTYGGHYPATENGPALGVVQPANSPYTAPVQVVRPVGISPLVR